VSTIADYVGRKSDVTAFDGLLPAGEVLLTQQLASDTHSGKIVTGIQKLVQRFLLELLTEQDSMPYLPERGCLFLYEARAGYWHTQLEVQGAFARAVSQIRRNLRNDEIDSDPDDERFGSAELLGVSLSAGAARLSISLASLAGIDRPVILPITVTV
jgi:hypothetical protein